MNYSYLALIFFVLVIIGVIITIVILNRGNKLDIVASLPNYKIFYLKDKTYVQLLNIDPFKAPPNPPLLIGNPFWIPYVVANNNDCLPIWAFDNDGLTSNFNTLPPNSKLIRIVNVIYNETGAGYVPVSPTGPLNPVPSKIGYLKAFQSFGANLTFTPSTDKVNADIFLYTSLGENLFTLHRVESSQNQTLFKPVFIEDGYFLADIASKPTHEADTFQLVFS